MSKCLNSNLILENNKVTKSNPSLNYGEILRPFFSKKQFQKGEAEVIGLAFVMHKSIYNFILDDGEARKIVKKNISELIDRMIGTVGFIGHCHCNFSLFPKDVALNLLHEIKDSTFFVEEEVLISVKNRIVGC